MASQIQVPKEITERAVLEAELAANEYNATHKDTQMEWREMAGGNVQITVTKIFAEDEQIEVEP